jgi:hypothetical protein
MSLGEIGFLALVLCGFTAFAVTVFTVSWPRAGSPRPEQHPAE